MKPSSAITEAVSTAAREFGSIYRVEGSPYLYYQFRYFGKRVRFSSPYADTSDNRKKLRVFLNLIRDQIAAETFRYAETFPGESEKHKEFFTRLEGDQYRPKPDAVLFGDYARRWKAAELPTYPVETREDYEGIITSRLLPMLEDEPFSALNDKRLRNFLESLRHGEAGAKAGRYLSIKRMRNILIPLRAIFQDACEEYHWALPFPEQAVKKKLAQIERIMAQEGSGEDDRRREVLLLAEWLRLQPYLGDHFRPFFTVSLITGLIFSELCGLKKECVKAGHLEIREVVVRGRRKKCGKTFYRRRSIPLTDKLRALLDEAMARSGGSEYVFTAEDGGPLDYQKMLDLWKDALTAAGIPYRVPYALRHTIVEWALLIGMHRARLQSMIGHGSRKMIDEVYGSYREGLVGERTQILEFLGVDFLELEELKATHPILYAKRNLLANGSQPSAQAVQEASQLVRALMAQGILTPEMFAGQLPGSAENGGPPPEIGKAA